MPPLGFHSQGLSARRAATICTIIPVWNGEVCDIIHKRIVTYLLDMRWHLCCSRQKQHLYRICNWRDYNRAVGEPYLT